MISLSELLFQPVTLPPALNARTDSAGVLPVPGAFALTLESAVAARQLPVSDTEVPKNAGLAVLPAATEGELEALGELLISHAAGVDDGEPATTLPNGERAVAVPLAVPATTTEGTGQGRPSGNGLPPPGPESGKTPPDAPLPRFQPAYGAPAATGRNPAPQITHMEMAAAVQRRIADTVNRSDAAAPVEARPAAVAEAITVAAREARATAQAAHTVTTPVVPRAGAAAASTTAQPLQSAATSSLAAAAGPSAGAAGAAELSMAAAPELEPAAEALDRGARQSGAQGNRQLGAVERRALDPFADVPLEARRTTAPDAGQVNLQRNDALPAADTAAVAAVLDRRTIAEAAGQRRAASEPSVPAEAVDRTPATGTESAEQSSKPQTARAAVPVLAARDLSALAERIETLIHRRGGVANLNLSLEELGDVEIRVRLESRQAHVQFVVQDAAVRESLEAQLPRLRALLGEGGLELGDIGMNMREGTGGNAERDADEGGRRRRVMAERLAVEEPTPRRRPGDDGRIVDAFA